jgi:hypothetical protein
MEQTVAATGVRPGPGCWPSPRASFRSWEGSIAKRPALGDDGAPATQRRGAGNELRPVNALGPGPAPNRHEAAGRFGPDRGSKVNPRNTSDKLPDGGHCPGCGGPLERVHRHALDRFVSTFRSVHRYRCTDPQCGWEGVVGRESAGVTAAALMTWRSRLVWLLGGVALAVAAMTPVLLATRARPAASPTAAAESSGAALQDDGVDMPIPWAGLHDEGVELAHADPRVRKNLTPLALRRNCVWGSPGRTPYRGTVEQALKATQLLPPEVVQRISEMAENGWTKDRVEISRTAIRTVDGRRVFRPVIPAMGFGDAMCFETRVNFAAGHVEYAALYEAQDRAGKTYSVMVPFVCNNVSVLGVRAEADLPIRQVPEPPGWWLVVTALGMLAWRGRRPSGEQA